MEIPRDLRLKYEYIWVFDTIIPNTVTSHLYECGKEIFPDKNTQTDHFHREMQRLGTYYVVARAVKLYDIADKIRKNLYRYMVEDIEMCLTQFYTHPEECSKEYCDIIVTKVYTFVGYSLWKINQEIERHLKYYGVKQTNDSI